MKKTERERIMRAVARLKRRGVIHPTDLEVSNEAAIPAAQVEKLRKQLQKE